MPTGLIMDAKVDVSAGYSHNLCARCSNGAQTVDIDNWSITQDRDCSTSLQVATATDVTQQFDATGPSASVEPSASFTTWDAFFQNLDTTVCPITSCVVANAGDCSTAISPTELTINSNSPWDITMSVQEPSGYSFSLCVTCTNGLQSISIDNWAVVLNSIDCSATMSPGSTPDVTNIYDASLTGQVLLGTDWDTFFSNTEPTDCAITSCTLWKAGLCGVEAFTETEVWLDWSSVGFLADFNVVTGYSHSVCVRCSNGQQDIDLDNWTITQEPDCSTSLQPATATDVSLIYNSIGATVPVTPSAGFTTWNAFFQNSEVAACPITNCIVGNGGSCGTAGSFTGLSIDTSSPWDISASVQVAGGYQYNLCVRCYNGPNGEFS